MVMHYSTNGETVACGRTGNNLSSSAVEAEVDCKSCQRSLTKVEAAPAKKAPSLAELRKQRQASLEQAKAAEFCFKASWRARLLALPDRCRLPRGMAPQAFV
ncbi:hypothetical protein [Pseudomonas sp. zfem002]|uniref:hypothetical protein n=1 Tax=Pseudomonas sp. zfem002 TaxID=3078197 RepID=UPI002929C9C7|nr:hypothetical protein [Pseudomonas sp. zfem002]MDU9390691.1 hypothetical protein [Pseudomonas sp. zfem002]